MNFKNFVLGVGIVIVFGLLLWQGIETFYPSPNYEDFCPFNRVIELVDTKEECELIGGMWNWNVDYPKPNLNSSGYCDTDYTCRQEYEESSEKHSQIVFYISLIVGFIALFVGYYILSIEPVGSALMGSGVWAIFWGSAINWRNFGSIWRFLLLLLALVLLVWFALRINRKSKRNFFSFKK